ncbi:hypothetical protein SAMN05421678_11083 [Actinopolymorpha cephalotaxi]|uniref:Amidohydrolase-related domain-containing protein n=1 Tax=Actinopolymorpha cephalotaxi TaxID=504797 RepID=A0A1I2W4C8_9ACTN|nr:amidohydrolase family protein [Actinopolymorpha cephalotaxi]NYH82763.1 hypothetical protein [Actinopolymorpha cephalotaxi]SFG96152.1 hypothetical protein SAMN05421678_11083 [Actinopolymorpha cephalotaxi]
MADLPLADLPLVDAHCHPVFVGSAGVSGQERAEFERMLGEADRPAPVGVSYADSLLGAAVRRWCTPPLGLPAGAPLDTFLDRRAELGPVEVARRLLGAAGLSYLLVDTGIGGTDGAGSDWWSVRGLASAAGAVGREVVRLESVVEGLAESGVAATDFADAYVDALATATRNAVAVKSILGYRHGFDVDPRRPSRAEVTAAARDWLLSRRDLGIPQSGTESRPAAARLRHEVLLRFVLWCGVDRGLPVQLHTGFGDRDLRLPSVNPALLQPLIEAVEPVGTPLVLLHCYPYQREAGWLAAVYPHVYVDVGLTVGQVGARAGAVLAEFCELAPFGKLMFSTDAYRLPERYLVGAAQFRHSFGRLLRDWWRDGDLTARDTERVAAMVGADNARRLYAIDG